jgi:glycosyltransferase involved in cell wall biosynthesis
MGRGAAIIANDVPEHREVLTDAGRYYARNDGDDLAAAMTNLVADPHERDRLGAAARDRAHALYSWDHVADEYERLFHGLVGRAS